MCINKQTANSQTDTAADGVPVRVAVEVGVENGLTLTLV